MSVTEVRTLGLYEEDLLAPWFTTPLAETEAICTYSNGGIVSVTFGPLHVATTLGTPIVLQLFPLPMARFDQTNLNPMDLTRMHIDIQITGFLNGVLTTFPNITNQLNNDPQKVLRMKLYQGSVGTPFSANSEIYIFQTTLTYKWGELPEKRILGL